jgi:hypothetical protein
MDITAIRNVTQKVQQTSETMRQNVRPAVEAALLKLGATTEHLARINYPNAVYNSTLLSGYVPSPITIKGNIVVRGVNEVLGNYHPEVVFEFKRSFTEHLTQFMWMTWGEPWWNGASFNVVETDADYLEYLRYVLSTRNEGVRGFVRRGRGRPKSADTIARERSPAYADWLRACALYRAEVDAAAREVKALEQGAKEQEQAWRAELAERIKAQKQLIESAKARLHALRKQGAPKLDK